MSEVLLRSSDAGDPSNPQIYHRLPKQGDILAVLPDKHPWGECELGGPTYTRQNTTLFVRQVKLLIDNKVDLKSISDPRELSKQEVLLRTVGNPVVVADETDIPVSVDDMVVSAKDQTLEYNLYERKVTSTEIRPISDHPNGNHSFWRIIQLPNISGAELTDMMVSEVDKDPQNLSPYLQFRTKFVDWSKVPKGDLITYLLDDERTQSMISLSYTVDEFAQIVSVRTPVPF